MKKYLEVRVRKRICNLCWKDLTTRPATIIRFRSSNRNYLVCNECLDKHEELTKDENL